MPDPWYLIANANEVPSPAVVIYPDRVRENLRRMVALAGGVAQLRPHVKTHKMAEIVRMQLDLGIKKFKCATLTEAEMVARTGAADVLLAHQPVGPNVARLCRLAAMFPAVQFSTIVDDEGIVKELDAQAREAEVVLDVLLDIDNGMHRTGIPPGNEAFELYRLVATCPGLRPGGLHVYDGHVREEQLSERAKHAQADMAPVDALRHKLESAGLAVPRVVAGGTPTFPVHSRRSDLECSPGTCTLWDTGYGERFRDLDFLNAAVVFTRVISRPGDDRLCLDLGYKAIAADQPQPRVSLFGLENAEMLVHNEEHLAIATPSASRFRVGDALYGVPRHICPTCALHREAIVVRDGRAVDRWLVAARDRGPLVENAAA